MKIKIYYFSLVILASVILLFSAFRFADADDKCGKDRNKSIIKFSHKVHQSSVECEACHVNVSESVSLKGSLLPDKPICAQCHSEEIEDNEKCGFCHYDGVFEKLIPSKSSLIFNHKYHIKEEKLNCSECHQGLTEVNYSFEAPKSNPDMKSCYRCHNDESAPNTCSMCHISTADLLPQNHKVSNFNKTHKFYVEAKGADCQVCHNDEFCQSCHTGTTKITELNKKDNFYLPYLPETYIDNTKQQKITRVHDLNYVYTHSIDAKGKSSDCQTCHQVETFCASCHTGYPSDFSLGGVTPKSHKVQNFVTIGVGTGGGEHAKLAKRDIASCASCHDYDGGDPTCTLCHIDNDGIKGTNPKTHKTGYMKDVKGDWHDSNGSLCYTCHTSSIGSKVFGVGFCGYCHTKKI